MPMVDVVIPEAAFTPDVEGRLIREITDSLIRAEGFDPAKNSVAQSVSVVFVHRPAATYVGGEPAAAPRYRVIPAVPEGKYTADAVRRLVSDLTDAFARAEGRTRDEVGPRLLIFPTDVPEGRWGARGVIRGIADIQAMLGGEHERELGARLLSEHRRAKARVVLGSLSDRPGDGGEDASRGP